MFATSSRVSRQFVRFASVAYQILRQFASVPYKLPDLTYGEIMKIHHQKHHQAYVTNFNAAIEKCKQDRHLLPDAEAERKQDIAAMVALQPALRFNGGGHINHSIFWQNLAPTNKGGGALPAGALATAINAEWGSLDNFKTKFNAMAVGVQGSGWGWLGWNKDSKRLEMMAKPNQDPLTAYYLQYKNVRPDYLKAIWSVVNWADVAARLQKASS